MRRHSAARMAYPIDWMSETPEPLPPDAPLSKSPQQRAWAVGFVVLGVVWKVVGLWGVLVCLLIALVVIARRAR